MTNSLEGTACAELASRYRMIESIEIENFRCFRRLSVQDCAPINVIVGDNGVGKTTLLEAIFWALAHSTDKAIHLRQYRGGDPQITGDMDTVVRALFSDFFYKQDLTLQPKIKLLGSGEERRSLRILKGSGGVRIPRSATSANEKELVAPINLEWTDWRKKKHVASVVVSPKGVEFHATGEKLPNWMFYASQVAVPARENANRFSDLNKQQRQEFETAFTTVFDWLENISVEAIAGVPVLSATDKRTDTVLPISALSGGVNRMAAILLAIASRQKGIVLVDEIESGIFYGRQRDVASLLLNFARQFECQLFLSTHSLEWLQAFISAAGKSVADLSLWRIMAASDGGPEVHKFDGETLKAGIEHGTEVRG